MTPSPVAATDPVAGHDPGQTRKATASGWIGSVLEYYDFFIYATAAALVFPQIFFPKGDPTVAIVASLATYGVGYVARPIGAVVLGHMGDTRGRKYVLVLCMYLMGLATLAVGLLPTYDQVGLLAPALLVVLRLIQGFAVAGEISGSSSMIMEHAPFGRRGYYASFTLQGVQVGQILAAAVFLPLATFLPTEAFNSWGWRIPFLLSFVVVVVGYYIRREVDETPAFEAQQGAESGAGGAVASAAAARPRMALADSPIAQAIRFSWRDMLRVMCMSLMNVIPVVATVFGGAYAVQKSYGIEFSASVYLWIPVLGNLVAVLVIPYVGNLSDRIGRRIPIVIGALTSGVLAYAYLWAISIHSVPLAVVFSLLMWGVVYQGYNAVFPSFYPETFPTRTRVSAMAISQNLGTTFTALLPALFATVAPPGSVGIPWVVGSWTLGITVVAALAALTARDTHRLRMEDLGRPDAVPVPLPEYLAAREEAIAAARREKAPAVASHGA